MSYLGADGKPIRVGDLVQVVLPRPCCPEHSRYGMTFVVERLSNNLLRCPHCNTRRIAPHAKEVGVAAWVDVSRLKRIPPLSELESVDESLKEPA